MWQTGRELQQQWPRTTRRVLASQHTWVQHEHPAEPDGGKKYEIFSTCLAESAGRGSRSVRPRLGGESAGNAREEAVTGSFHPSCR